MSDRNLLGDRYELGDVLGRGGMAEVRYGRDRRLGRAVAIKMLRVDHATDPTFQERFRREAQSAASLNHRNIVAVYDTGEDFFDGNSIPYIVMEYVEGRTLRELLQERVRFTPERSIEIASGVLDALEYSHRAGIVHRDIKPGNVMINNAGEVNVMDFGIARSLAETGAALTQTAAVVGTAQYISPEQARGESADARSDLYAVGCVLYELLTGRPPFVGESLVSVAVSHVREMATPPSALDPSIPRDLDSVVLKALAKDRRERYQSAYEMRADLERIAAGMPVSAEATAATQFIGGAAAAGYADTAMYEPTAATGYDDGYDDYDDEDEDRRGMSWGALVGAGLAILAAALLIGYLIFQGDGGEEGPQTISVEDLRGMSLEDARASDWVVTNEIQLVPEEQVTENEDEIGTILAQNPPPQASIEQGGTITVTVGVGPEQATVPSLVGSTEAEARSALEDAGLSVGEVTGQETDDEDLWGTVASSDPAEGTSVDEGSAVDLVIHTEPDATTVPNLQNLTEDEAEAELDRNGLALGAVRPEPSDSIEEGRVIRSEPEFNASVEPGTRVDIWISEGAELVTVPSVANQGFTVSTYADAFEGLDLSHNVGDAEQNCDVEPGTIIDQNPTGGEEVAPGTNVTVIPATDEGCEDDGGGGGDGGGG
ncbi:MAG TPA: Stk1 family PASTA domain-containing Ser/Thr kinase [Jiangellaceae bacterium]